MTGTRKSNNFLRIQIRRTILFIKDEIKWWNRRCHTVRNSTISAVAWKMTSTFTGARARPSNWTCANWISCKTVMRMCGSQLLKRVNLRESTWSINCKAPRTVSPTSSTPTTYYSTSKSWASPNHSFPPWVQTTNSNKTQPRARTRGACSRW